MADDYRASILGKMDFFLYRCEAGNNFSMVNLSDGFERITGYPASKIIDNPDWGFIQLVHPEDTAIGTARCNRAIKEKQASWSSEYRIITATGAVKWVCDSCSIALDKNGRLKFLEGVIYNITDLHERVEKRQTEHIMHQLRYLKLLALSASIEAARLGSTGSGFNNLAQDMRTLAERTETAALKVKKSAA
jgi:PAS domain S-box-containing protein